MLAREGVNLPHEEDLEEVRATASRAAALGIRTELLRVSSLRPVRALLELATERQVGLLVFGPDQARIPRYRFRVGGAGASASTRRASSGSPTPYGR